MRLLLALLPVAAAVPPNHGSPASLPPGCLPKDGQQDLFCPVRSVAAFCVISSALRERVPLELELRYKRLGRAPAGSRGSSATVASRSPACSASPPAGGCSRSCEFTMRNVSSADLLRCAGALGLLDRWLTLELMGAARRGSTPARTRGLWTCSSKPRTTGAAAGPSPRWCTPTPRPRTGAQHAVFACQRDLHSWSAGPAAPCRLTSLTFMC
jgi:hypothetical protein